ncbi:MAG: hypothetical protein HY395_01720 [Candidatus Doudnabacteria bacterium]|nr:hypothetical protein [Candidatus Doudnabacteria bacterium]
MCQQQRWNDEELLRRIRIKEELRAQGIDPLTLEPCLLAEVQAPPSSVEGFVEEPELEEAQRA